MDICSHSFIGTPLRGRLSPEALAEERRQLDLQARRARVARLLEGDLFPLVAWIVTAESELKKAEAARGAGNSGGSAPHGAAA